LKNIQSKKYSYFDFFENSDFLINRKLKFWVEKRDFKIFQL
jgi:hypothetical protein